MSHGSSELLLKALEQSKEDPNTVLDHAASIARIKLDRPIGLECSTNTNAVNQTNSFREQWLLRWISKKLNEAFKNDPHSHQLMTNSKTWSLISQLLMVIPRHKSIEILIERNFTTILASASKVLTRNDQTTITSESVQSSSSNNTAERPRKKRRLSPATGESSDLAIESGSTKQETAVLQFLVVVDAWARLLQPEKTNSTLPSRQVVPAWSESISNATDFIGSISSCASALLRSPCETDTEKFVASVIMRWLGLWRIYSTSNVTVDKATTSKSFNAVCLGPCLEIYNILSSSKKAHLISVKRELERQIALFTILPIRSVFNTKLPAMWKQEDGVISWEDIQSSMKIIHAHLGTALHTEIVVNREILSLPDSTWAPHLISIASRLVPAEDFRRRQRETPWLQSFILCLTYLTYPREIPRFYKSDENRLQPAADELPPNSDELKRWPDDLLNVIHTEKVKFLSPVQEYLTACILGWRHRPLPTYLLSAVVRLGPNSFVPSVGGPNSTACLESLLFAIAESRTFDQVDYDRAVKNIVSPVMEAFAKTRDFDGMLQQWVPNLEEALRVRVTAQFTADAIPTALVWDDEDIFKNFMSLCQKYPAIDFDQRLLDDVVGQFETIAERIGPTTYIFAKLAILENVLKARGSSFLTSPNALKSLYSLVNLLTESVKKQNDYQGQRWRIWSTLTTLARLDLQLSGSSTVTDAIQDSCTRFQSTQIQAIDTLRQSQRSAVLKEQHAMFCYLVEQYVLRYDEDSAETTRLQEVLAVALGNVAATVQTLEQPASVDQKSLFGADIGALWDGKINNLQHIKHLVEGQLARLIKHVDLLETQDEPLSKALMSIEKSLRGAESDRTQASPGESLLSLVLQYLSSSQKQVNGQTLVNYTRTDSLPDEPEHGRPEPQRKPLSQPSINELALGLVSKPESAGPLKAKDKTSFLQIQQSPVDLERLVHASAIVSNIDEVALKDDPDLANAIVSSVQLEVTWSTMSRLDLVFRLEYCMLILGRQPGVINQATIDTLLKNLAITTTATPEVGVNDIPEIESNANDIGIAIYDRLIAVVGLLLARYRRRLTGRMHLLLPVLQNLLKCLFYCEGQTYIYQNAATSKQKQAFRSSLPRWLDQALPKASAIKFAKILSSICNPTTASARSAHRGARKAGSRSLELNDETKRARKIAGQHMQYLILEYARCSLDGVIQPEVRESVMPGLYSVLDAMDRDLMKGMNAAMDPSSRAIFRGTYDDWTKYWRWNQT